MRLWEHIDLFFIMQEKKVRPVTVLTGFLGAGKTTFLNALMASNSGTRYAIIENEVGQLNVDGMLVSRNYGQLIELQDGCLCCTLNDDLYGALEVLHQQSDSYDELIIECTGLALPATIIEPFTVHPIFKKFFPLKRTICIVDAELIEDQISEHDEVLRQLTASDAIVINKTDYVRPSYVTYLQERLARINPFAGILRSHGRNEFPLMGLENVTYSPPRNFFSLARKEDPASPGIIQKTNAERHFFHDISTRTYSFDGEFNFIHLYLGLSKLVGKHRDKIYRMKGVGFKAGERKKIIVQSVGARVDMDYGGYWQEGETRQNAMVFIGKDIDNLHIETLLTELLSINTDKAY